MRHALAMLVGLSAACASAPSLTSFPALAPAERSCLSEGDHVTWVHAAPATHQRTLDAWCASVGPPWRHTVTPPITPARTVAVVSWNMNVGRGRLDELLSYLDAELNPEMNGERFALVLLLQEVHRSGAAVPASARFAGTTPKVLHPPVSAPDIVHLAETRGWSAIYVPSMRNGDGQDRGNAVVSSEALSEWTAIELPFGKQRRVAVGATISSLGSADSTGMRVISTHLDTSRARVTQAEALAVSLGASSQATIIGGDLNAVEGQHDGAFTALAGRLSAENCGARRTHAWPWRLDLFFGGWVGRLDQIFTNLPTDRWLKRCSTIPHLFGSDHRPLLLVLTRT